MGGLFSGGYIDLTHRPVVPAEPERHAPRSRCYVANIRETSTAVQEGRGTRDWKPKKGLESVPLRAVKQDRHTERSFQASARNVADLEEAVKKGDAAGIRHALDAKHASHLKGLERQASERLESLQRKARERLRSMSAAGDAGKVAAAIRQAEAAGVAADEIDQAWRHLEQLKPSKEEPLLESVESEIARAIDLGDVDRLAMALERAKGVAADPGLISEAAACEQELWRACLCSGEALGMEMAAVLAKKSEQAPARKGRASLDPLEMGEAVRDVLDLHRLLSSGKFARASPEKLFCKGLEICASSGGDRARAFAKITTRVRFALHHLHRVRRLCDGSVQGFASYRVRLYAQHSSLRMSVVHLRRALVGIGNFCETKRCFENMRKRPYEQCARACASVDALLVTWSVKVLILRVASDMRGLDDIVQLVSSFAVPEPEGAAT